LYNLSADLFSIMVSAPMVYNLSIKVSFYICAFRNEVLSGDYGALKD
jgi:hypothetical protein